MLQLDGTNENGVVFRDRSHEKLLSLLAGHLPAQLALGCQDSRVSSKTAAGKRAKWLPHARLTGGQTWCKRFYCVARGCATVVDVSGAVPRDADSAIVIACTFTSATCVHLVGDVYGQLRGNTRKEWAKRRLKPHALQLAALQEMSQDRALTGNMQNLPRRSAAQRLSSEEHLSLQRQKDLLQSLQDMVSAGGTQEWLRCLSLKPASILVLSESETFLLA